MPAWEAAGRSTTRVPLIGVAGLEGSTVLDVRQDNEFAAGHIPGSAHVELGALTHPGAEPDGLLTVTCGHGERAMTGASLLERVGHYDLCVLDGGIEAWTDAGRPLEPGA